jgi:arylsulfatase
MAKRSKPARARLRQSASALALLLAVAPPVSMAQPVAPAPAQAPAWKHYPEAPKPAAGAPNVLLIMTDDVGFGAASTFGGPVPTPAFDALAAEGLRYNAFHTTAMCSPTRAALLTGRNHHAVASGSIADVSLDEEGYTSVIPKSAATVARVLHDHGYDTSFFGKNHNTPVWENTPVGPFDNWPNAWGFDYFYGFNGPFADQFHPSLIDNRNPVRPADNDPGYILDRDLADHLIHWIQVQHSLRPDHPFFAYFASGSTHAPHMAPPEWIARFKGRFDQGWDKLRAETFERQKKLGVVPANTVMSPRPDSVPAWDSLTPERKRIYARMMEVAAAQLAYADDQFGRVIDSLRRSGQLDNTMVIYIQGDNGASMEDFFGSNQERRVIAGIEETDADFARDIDKHGGPQSFGNYPAGWAWATNAPLQWAKRVASHLGGLRDGMVISWPDRIKQKGQLRTQFGHVTDIAPTIYEAAHITAPKTVDGVTQMPIDGTSLVYTFDNPQAPSRHREQYFEMLGNRSYYKDGWMASTLPGRLPWGNGGTAKPEDFKWALYDLNTDWAQATDVSAKYPKKLEELKADFDRAAKANHVYPLNADLNSRLSPTLRPSLVEGRTSFTFYPGDTRYTPTSFPAIGRGMTVTATVGVGGGPAQGPVLVQGDHFGGQGLLLDQGRVTWLYNVGDLHTVYTLQAPEPLKAGEHVIAVRFTGAPSGPGTTVDLTVDGQSVARGQFAQPVQTRGEAYIGHPGIAPLADGPDIPAIPAACGCEIRSVKIDRNPSPR